MAVNLSDKIEAIQETFKEVAFGWNDSGCFWHFSYGPRGTGDMMAGFGERFDATEASTFEESVDAFLRHLAMEGIAVEVRENRGFSKMMDG